MTECGAHAGKELGHPERLRDIIIGTEVKRLSLARFIISTGQHNNRNALVSSPHHLQQLKPLYVGQTKIKNYQVWLFCEQLKSCPPVGGIEDFIALRTQTHTQQPTHLLLIVDHEDFERIRH